MGTEPNLKGKQNRFASSAIRSRGIVWCFLPANRQVIGSCSVGFRNYFDLPANVRFPILFSDGHLIRGLESRGLSIERLMAGEVNSGVSTNPEHPEAPAIASEVVFDGSGLPTGRILTFERARMTSLPAHTVQRLRNAQRQLSVLSPREAEIVDLVYTGLTNKAIGLQSRISEKTVEKHRSNIMSKLGFRSTPHLIRCVNEARLANELEVLD